MITISYYLMDYKQNGQIHHYVFAEIREKKSNNFNRLGIMLILIQPFKDKMGNVTLTIRSVFRNGTLKRF